MRIPTATYRLQFNRRLTFRDARDLVPYLDELGVSDLYASPLLQPMPWSDHGYDVADHGRLNAALGGAEEFDRLVATLQSHGLGLLLDVVPNHMGIAGGQNAWWNDVLENGPSSPYAAYFDIDWEPTKLELRNKVLLPVLEDQYGNVLEAGKLRLRYAAGAFWVELNGSSFPLAPDAYGQVLGRAITEVAAALGSEHEQTLELQSILTALSYLPASHERAPERMVERQREKEIIKRRIATLCAASPAVQRAIEAAVEAYQPSAADPRSYDRLDELLAGQPYRLAFWRVAAEEVNYRRFFDINDLAAIRVELPEVFEATHRLVFDLIDAGKVTGLRIDHPDGLWSPARYFAELQRRAARAANGGAAPAEAQAEASAPAERGPRCPALYVVAEKVLARGESLPEDWAVAGTTGYDFLNAVNGLFVDGANQRAFDEIYRRFVGAPPDYRALVGASKRMIMLVSLVSEINLLAHQLNRISEKNRRYRDFTLNSLTFAIREVIACLPVYRTYIDAENGAVLPRDQAYIERAVAEAKRRNPRTAASLFDFVRDTLLLRNLAAFRPEDRDAVRQFVMKFQQVTGPVMAKGVEDTAFYSYNRLVSLNEVGGDPDQFGWTVAAFHRQNAERLARWPHALLTLSTHDTKRSEDVRARINVLSELPREWRAALNRWRRLNRGKKARADGAPAPDRNDEYLLYQTLLGTWPDEPLTADQLAAYRERIAAYLLKATREAKVHTSWINPNEAYEAATERFVAALLARPAGDPFVDDLQAVARRVAFFGRLNSLAQKLLELTSPGVPDTYQGTELWDLSLVDPDNRRPVDFARRRALLDELLRAAGDDDLRGVPRPPRGRPGAPLRTLAAELVERAADGRIKLYLVARTLRFRRERAALFQDGAYLPLDARGPKREHVVAFARVAGEDRAVVVAPRLVVGLCDGKERPPCGAEVWGDTELALPAEWAGTTFRSLYTGERLTVGADAGGAALPLAAVLGRFPVALLVAERAARGAPDRSTARPGGAEG